MLEVPICHLGNTIDPVWNTCVKIIQPGDELPVPDFLESLYLDVETTSCNPLKPSINPHIEIIDEEQAKLTKLAKLLGISFLFDDEKIPYYIPLRHYVINDNGEKCYSLFGIPNYNLEKTYDWLRKILSLAEQWVNHNIKYDYHIIFNEIGPFRCPRMIDTLNLSKLAPMEERFSYGLTEVMGLFGIDITPYEKEIHRHLGKKYKDYGIIPAIDMGPYAAVDVLCVKYLHEKLTSMIPEECNRVVDMETQLLPELIRMEQIGIRVDTDLLIKDWHRILPLQVGRIHKIQEKTGFDTFRPNKRADLEELFVNRLGLNLKYSDSTIEKLEKGVITEDQEDEISYSYGYDSIMKNYHVNPLLFNVWFAYQDDQKLLSSYIMPYLEEFVTSEGLIHSNFNQILRTGRMSMTLPSMQVLPLTAKVYIIPYDDTYLLVEFDLSQIEFRVIAHYINNRRTIEQYNRDPTTDFHTWVATLCNIPRKPAKNVNFMLGYGGGKRKCVAMLSELPQIVGELNSPTLINNRAIEVYNSYHANLPELKPTSYRAADVMKARGYVKTLLGRHRHLPYKFAHKAFNSVCQGTAADIQKDITLRLRKFFSIECLPHFLVHDSWLFSIKKNRAKELIPEIKHEIERPIEGVNFSVPLLSDFGVSEKNWRECDD